MENPLTGLQIQLKSTCDHWTNNVVQLIQYILPFIFIRTLSVKDKYNLYSQP